MGTKIDGKGRASILHSPFSILLIALSVLGLAACLPEFPQPVEAPQYRLFTLDHAVADGQSSPIYPSRKITLTLRADTADQLPPALKAENISVVPVTDGMTLVKGEVSGPVTTTVNGKPGQIYELGVSQVNITGRVQISIAKEGYFQNNSPLVRELYGLATAFRGVEEEAGANDGTRTTVILEFSEAIPGGLAAKNIAVTPSSIAVTGVEPITGEPGKYRLGLSWGTVANWNHTPELSILVDNSVVSPTKRQVFLSMRKIDPIPSFSGGLALRRVPGGTFKRDAQGGTISVLEKAYWMGETEVTNQLWETVMGYNPGGSMQGDNKPVRNVTWIEAIVFCNKLSIKAGREPVYNVNIPYHKTCLLPWKDGPLTFQKWLYAVPEKDKGGNDIDDVWVSTKWPGKDLDALKAVVGKANQYILDNGTWINNPDYSLPYDPDWESFYGWEADSFPSTYVYDYNDDPGGFKTLIPPLRPAIKDKAGWIAFNVGNGIGNWDSDWPFIPSEWLNLTRQERSDGWYDGWDIKVGDTWYRANKVDAPPDDVPRIPYYDDQGALHHYEIEIISINKDANGYRLPAHQQWMWAAMGADMSPAKLSNVDDFTGVNATDYAKPFAGYNGYNNAADYAWFNDTTIQGPPQVVGTKKPNELGIYDLSGNVHEWCYDQWDNGGGFISFPPPGGINYYVPKPMGDHDHYMTSDKKVLKGGSYTSWMTGLAFVNTGDQRRIDDRRADQGLRVMRWVQPGE